MDARCPRCSTVFTTDRSGIQFCPNCGQQVDVPAPPQASGAGWGQSPGPGPGGGGGFGAGRFTGEPPPGGGPLPGHRELTPWERRKELGLVHGFFETWKRSMFSPQQFFPTVRPDVPWSEALYYAWIIHGITVVLGLPFVGLGLFRPEPPEQLRRGHRPDGDHDAGDVRRGRRGLGAGLRCSSTRWWSWRRRASSTSARCSSARRRTATAPRCARSATPRDRTSSGSSPASGSSPGSTAWSWTSSASPASRRRAPARPPASCSCPSSSSSAAAGSSASSSPRHRRAGQRDGRQRRHLALGSR